MSKNYAWIYVKALRKKHDFDFGASELIKSRGTANATATASRAVQRKDKFIRKRMCENSDRFILAHTCRSRILLYSYFNRAIIIITTLPRILTKKNDFFFLITCFLYTQRNYVSIRVLLSLLLLLYTRCKYIYIIIITTGRITKAKNV